MTTKQNRQREQGATRERLIVECLAAGQKTVEQICAALDMKSSNVAVYLARLRATPRRIYICGHEPRQGRPAPIFAAGDRPDVEYVPQSRPTPKTSAEQRREQVLALLTEKPRTRDELARRMHLVAGAAGRYVTELRRPEARQLYIADWRHPSQVHDTGRGGDWTPVYAVGTKKDKRKPVEGKAARHRRLQKDPAYREDRNVKRRARYAIQKATKKKQGIFAALGL